MDQDLVMQAQHGDQRAFEMLTVANHSRLYRVAYGILRDRHLAEDATQQAFLDIWRHIRRLRDPAEVRGWSYRLLVRACYAEARRRPTWVPTTSIPPGDIPLAADAYGAVIDRDQLERGFARLSLEHRPVLVLRCLLDMTPEEVAETLGIPAGPSIPACSVPSRHCVPPWRPTSRGRPRASPGPPGGRSMNDDRLLRQSSRLVCRTGRAPPDPRAGASPGRGKRLPQTRAASARRWSLPILARGRRPSRPPADRPTYQPSPIPATNGHTPTVIGRTQFMFSPVKAITAGALVFALGGVMLIAQPFEQRGSVPGRLRPKPSPRRGSPAACSTWTAAAQRQASRTMAVSVATATSARSLDLQRPAPDRRRVDAVERGHLPDGRRPHLGRHGGSLSAERGRRLGVLCRYVAKGSTPTEPPRDNTFTCHGDDGYEGLTAVLVTTPASDALETCSSGRILHRANLPPAAGRPRLPSRTTQHQIVVADNGSLGP